MTRTPRKIFFNKEDFTETGLDKIIEMYQTATSENLRSRRITIEWPRPVLISTYQPDEIVVRVSPTRRGFLARIFEKEPNNAT